MRFLDAYTAALAVLRVALFWCAAIAAVVCGVDWAIRTRRISPFNGLSRFFRARIDPLMVPVERVVIRSGGMPASAPWWSLVAIVVGGLLVLYLLQVIGGMIAQAVLVSGGASLARLLIAWIFALLRIALIVRVISSWLPVSPYSWTVRWSYVLTDWMIVPLRRVLPTVGMLDLSPLVAYLGLVVLQTILGV